MHQTRPMCSTTRGSTRSGRFSAIMSRIVLEGASIWRATATACSLSWKIQRAAIASETARVFLVVSGSFPRMPWRATGAGGRVGDVSVAVWPIASAAKATSTWLSCWMWEASEQQVRGLWWGSRVHLHDGKLTLETTWAGTECFWSQ